MKKVFSSIFACIAMAGLLTSCVEEQFKTAFEIDAAEVHITAKVIDISTGNDVTSQSTISASVGSVSGNVVTLVGNNTITATTVTVTASYTSPKGNVYTSTGTVDVNPLRAGGVGHYNVRINVGEITPIGDYTIFVKEELVDTVVEKYFFDKAVIKEEGSEMHWAHNESEYLLFGKVNYEIKSGCEVFASDAVPAWKTEIEARVAKFEEANPVVIKNDTKEITVSAWSYFTAWVSLTVNEMCITYCAEDKMGNVQEIGTMQYWQYATCVFEYDEKASPSHAEHYIAGHGYDDAHDTAHGHGHGISHGNNNAGGGIIIAD